MCLYTCLSLCMPAVLWMCLYTCLSLCTPWNGTGLRCSFPHRKNTQTASVFN
uniref:Uncharacterized protein n=1 Tax=Anguilla anguilla TaxID=7936 RepID=A0A0E9V2D5_ANGAN